MLDNHLLEELATFAQTKTLAETATKLNITQPTVTRGMQKLEEQLGVKLFERHPNRLTLNATGKLAAAEATRLLAAQREAVTRIRNFDSSHQTFPIATTLPGPLLYLQHIQERLPTTTHLPTTLLAPERVTTALTSQQAIVVLTNQPLDTPLITSQSIGIERLAVNLNQFMYQANQATVSFAELQGLNFIVLRDIGPWRDIIQQAIPNAQFFYQEQRAALLALTKSANLPFFTTNLSIFDPTFTTNQVTEQRVCLPINDVAAQMTVYATYLRTEKTRVQPLITQLSTHWPN